jgi:hypothetical protein
MSPIIVNFRGLSGFSWGDSYGLIKNVPSIVSYSFEDTCTLFDVIKLVVDGRTFPSNINVSLRKYKPMDTLKDICDKNNVLDLSYLHMGMIDIGLWCEFASNGMNIYDIYGQNDIFNLECFGMAHGTDDSSVCPCGCKSEKSMDNNTHNMLIVTYLSSKTYRAYNKYNYIKYVATHRKDPITHQIIDNKILEYIIGQSRLTFVSY